MRCVGGGVGLVGGSVLPGFVLAVGGFLALVLVLWLSREGVRPLVVGGERSLFRLESLAEVRAEGEGVLGGYGVVSVEGGIYRIPIEEAMGAVVREWRLPEEALDRLGERVDLAATVSLGPVGGVSEFE